MQVQPRVGRGLAVLSSAAVTPLADSQLSSLKAKGRNEIKKELKEEDRGIDVFWHPSFVTSSGIVEIKGRINFCFIRNVYGRNILPAPIPIPAPQRMVPGHPNRKGFVYGAKHGSEKS